MLSGQTISLASLSANPGSTVVLGLSLANPTTVPAGLQWTLSWPANQTSAISVTAGTAAVDAGKSLTCGPAQNSMMTCLLAGLNTNGIGAGVVANVQVTLAPTASTSSISVLNPVGVDGTGTAIPSLSATGGTIAVPALSSVVCGSGGLVGLAVNCTVTLNQIAPAGGTTVVLSSSSRLLGVPASVTVPAGTTTATFPATFLTQILSNLSVTVIATLGGSSQSGVVGLSPPEPVSGVQCNPASLGQSVTGVCTVTITQAAPAGGTSVALASNNSLLTVAPSVTVPAGATTAVFLINAAATIPSIQSATITATSSGTASAALRLVAPTVIWSLNCSPATLPAGSTANCGVGLNQTFPAISIVHVTTCPVQSFPGSTCNIPGTGSGNLIVVGWQTGSGANTALKISGIADNAGNTYTEAGPAFAVDTAGGSTADIWYAMNSLPGATSLTITPTAAVPGATVVIWELAGADIYNPIDQTAALSTQPAAGVLSGAPITTVNSGDIVVSLAATSGNVTGISPGSSFVADNSAGGGGWAHLIAPSPGTYAAQWTQNPAGTYASSTVAFRAASSVLLASNSASLSVPSLVTMPRGATIATFSASSVAAPSNQTATITATLGSSSQTTSEYLVALPPVQISGFTCSPTALLSGTTTVCSVTLSQPASANTTVSLNSNSILLSLPATLTIAAGSTRGSATAGAGIVLLNSQAVVTATLGASSQTAAVSLWTTPVLSSLNCSPRIIPLGSISTCTLTLSQATANLSVGVSSTNAALAAPASVNVAQGASSAVFSVAAVAAASGWVILTASYNGTSAAVPLGITQPTQTSSSKPRQPSGNSDAIHLRDMVCAASHLRAGTQAICEVRFRSTPLSQPAEINLTSSSASLRLPASVSVRPGQSVVKFRIEAVSSDHSSATISAQLANDAVQQTVTLDSAGPALSAPARLYGKPANTVSFRVTPSVDGATLSASNLPAGAVFDAASGDFQWTPGVSQLGTNLIGFTLSGPAGTPVTAQTLIEVDSGAPVITRVLNAASRSAGAVCSPGAIGSLEGRWLAEGSPLGDPRGQSTRLAGTMVKINGVASPVLSASPSRVDFLCPATSPGVSLEITLETPWADAQPVQTNSRPVAPGIFSLDESGGGQGAIVHAGTDSVAAIPDYRYASRVALAGDTLTIYATGIANAPEVKVAMGEIEVRPQSITPVPDRAGVFQIDVIVPKGLNEEVPVSLRIPMPDGSTVTSNQVSLESETSPQGKYQSR